MTKIKHVHSAYDNDDDDDNNNNNNNKCNS
jgi:hypothetical protein